MEDRNFFTCEEFAELFRISTRAVRAAIVSGRIRGFKVGVSRKFPWRIPVSEFYRVQSQGICEYNPNMEKEKN